MRIPFISSALLELKPGAEWTLRGDTYADLEWLDKTQTKPTEEEVNSKVTELQAAEPLKLLRVERNKRLTESDWVVTRASELESTVSDEWRRYRQSLRDLPTSASPKLNSIGELDLTSVTWPTKPS